MCVGENRASNRLDFGGPIGLTVFLCFRTGITIDHNNDTFTRNGHRLVRKPAKRLFGILGPIEEEYPDGEGELGHGSVFLLMVDYGQQPREEATPQRAEANLSGGVANRARAFAIGLPARRPIDISPRNLDAKDLIWHDN
jgi:hypothetical protein